MKVWPIYVPSKGRAGAAKLLEKAEGLTVFVEPQDKDVYDHHYMHKHDIRVLPEDDKGLANTRELIKTFAEKSKNRWYWIIDDDITNFYLVKNGKKFVCDIWRALEEAQKAIMQCPNVGIAALEYQQFAWANKKGFTVNSYCDCVVAINVKRAKDCHYNPLHFKEDRDFVLQILHAGFGSIRVANACFAAPKVGSNKGGLYSEYQAGKDLEGAKQLKKDWPHFVKIQKKTNGRWDAKINWSKAYAYGQAKTNL